MVVRSWLGNRYPRPNQRLKAHLISWRYLIIPQRTMAKLTIMNIANIGYTKSDLPPFSNSICMKFTIKTQVLNAKKIPLTVVTAKSKATFSSLDIPLLVFRGGALNRLCLDRLFQECLPSSHFQSRSLSWSLTV